MCVAPYRSSIAAPAHREPAGAPLICHGSHRGTLVSRGLFQAGQQRSVGPPGRFDRQMAMYRPATRAGNLPVYHYLGGSRLGSPTCHDHRPRPTAWLAYQAGNRTLASQVILLSAKNALEAVLEPALGRVGGRRVMPVSDPRDGVSGQQDAHRHRLVLPRSSAQQAPWHSARSRSRASPPPMALAQIGENPARNLL